MIWLWNLLFFVVVIALVVTIHEFGHFYVARRCGVTVKRFSIGFGKPLWRWVDKHQTEFVIAAIPLGGYVSMVDSRFETLSAAERQGAINEKTIFQRMAVVVAGPLANFIFSVFALWLMYMIGVQSVRPVIDAVTPSGIAEAAQLPVGGEVQALNDEPVRDWQDLQMLMLEQLGQPSVELTVSRDGVAKSYALDLRQWALDPEKETVMTSLGIVPVQVKALPQIRVVSPDSPAARAGLQVDDRILKAAEQPVQTWQDLVEQIQQHAGRSLVLHIERNGQLLDITVTPELQQTADGFHRGFLGVSPAIEPIAEQYRVTRQFGFVDAIPEATRHTWQLIRVSFSMFGKLLTGHLSLKHLSGPGSIAEGAGTTAAIGIIAFLSFLAFISVSIGAVNLLPLPILDGGHLMYLVVELIRGKPVSEKAQEVGFKFGAFVLLMLMGIALLNDFSRFL